MILSLENIHKKPSGFDVHIKTKYFFMFFEVGN